MRKKKQLLAVEGAVSEEVLALAQELQKVQEEAMANDKEFVKQMIIAERNRNTAIVSANVTGIYSVSAALIAGLLGLGAAKMGLQASVNELNAAKIKKGD